MNTTPWVIMVEFRIAAQFAREARRALRNGTDAASCSRLFRTLIRGTMERPDIDLQKSALHLQLMISSACQEISVEWVRFVRECESDDVMPLEENIELFVHRLRDFVDSRYPMLSPGSSGMFWLTALTAIVQSGTHPKSEVNAAIADLQLRYLRN